MALELVPVPTESEMATIRSIFNRAADAIVSASELGHRVSDLEQSMGAMQRELETVRNTNQWLSEQLGATRKERDDLSRELSVVKHEVEQVRTSLSEAQGTIQAHVDYIEALKNDLTEARGQRNEHSARADAAEAQLAKVEAKLAEAVAWMEDAHAMFVKKVATPEVVAPAPVFPLPEPSHAGAGDDGPSHDTAQSAPAPEQADVATGTDPYRW